MFVRLMFAAFGGLHSAIGFAASAEGKSMIARSKGSLACVLSGRTSSQVVLPSAQACG
jgi:hypothetical protein